MRIVVAPDSYKGSLTSLQVASTIKAAIDSTEYNDKVTILPMADGGEGTVDALLSSSGGKQIPVTCTGPLGNKIETYYAILENNIAIIEVANIAGLVQVPLEQRNPDITTSFGLGEVILDAIDKGCKELVIGLGGSATNDGGLGLLQALGVQAWNKQAETVNVFGRDLFKVDRLNFDQIDPRLKDVTIRVACDVDNPLCGEKGASAIFGPQKGASTKQVKEYDRALSNFAKLIEKDHNKNYQTIPGAGAAGGLGFTFLVLGAELVSGAKLISDAANMEDKIKQADLVITGEGQTDEQTLFGKAPGYIADLARNHNIPTILISGALAGDLDALRTKFAGCFSITNKPLSLEQCMQLAEELLFEQAKQVIHLVHSVRN